MDNEFPEPTLNPNIVPTIPPISISPTPQVTPTASPVPATPTPTATPAPTPVPTPTITPTPEHQPGQILRQKWENLTNETTVLSLTSLSVYPYHPSSSTYLNSFEAPTNDGEGFGCRIIGYLHPSISGNYTFWIASDDDAELWLSTDSYESNRQLIASVSGYTDPRQWDKFPSQEAAAINLNAGSVYFIEAIMRDGQSNDNLAVAWQPPGGSQEVIPGSCLSIYYPGSAPPLFEDDFEDGNADGWSVQLGTFYVIDDGGNMVYDYPTLVNEGIVITGESNWTDYSVEAKIKVMDFNVSSRAYLCGRYQDGDNFYAACLSSNKFEIRKKVDSAGMTLATYYNTYNTNTWYTVKLEMIGSNLKAYLNGTLELEVTDTDFASGVIGLNPRGVQARYDDIIVQ